MRKILVSQLKPGMVLAKAIYGSDGQLLLNTGVKLKSMYIAGLQRADIQYVYVCDPLLQGVHAEDVVSDATKTQAVKTMKRTLDKLKAGGLHREQLIDGCFISTVE